MKITIYAETQQEINDWYTAIKSNIQLFLDLLDSWKFAREVKEVEKYHHGIAWREGHIAPERAWAGKRKFYMFITL